jgi:hypothetical protein
MINDGKLEMNRNKETGYIDVMFPEKNKYGRINKYDK